MGALEKIRVLDVGRFIAGPVSATILGEFGAEVIKVELPRVGDDLRRVGWVKDGHSLWWSVEGRNKKSITLNLSHPRGQELLKRLLPRVDVLIENFRPGTLEAWGLGTEALTEPNPRLIFLRTSGYGQTGPYRERLALNTALESLGGLRYLIGEPDRPPARPGIALGDYAGALFGAIGILIALYERDANNAGLFSGKGQWIDNAIYEAVMRLTEYTIPAFHHLQRIRERVGGGSAGTAPARAMRAKDGQWVGVSAANDRMFGALCAAMGQPALAQDPRFVTNSVRIEHRDELHAIIEEWVAAHTVDEVVDILWEADVSAFPVYSAKDIVGDRHVLARESIVDVPDPILGHTVMQGAVPRLSRTPAKVAHAGPILGSSNEEIYRSELGLTEAEMAELQDLGVI